MAGERDFGKELDNLKAAMNEQAEAFKEAVAQLIKFKENKDGKGNNSNNGGPGYDSDENNASPHDKPKEEVEQLKQELEESLQEQFRMLRGPNPYGPMSINDLCLAPSVVIPKDFKMPEFIKFDGSTNPIMHLRMYCTKMGMWSKEENFLISFFPESLEGAAWEWFMQMDRTQIKCWEDLAQAFINQYKFNLLH